MTGAVYPAFGVVFGKAINSFSDIDPHQRRHDGDRNALYFFIIAVVSTFTIGIQNYMFGAILIGSFSLALLAPEMQGRYF